MIYREKMERLMEQSDAAIVIGHRDFMASNLTDDDGLHKEAQDWAFNYMRAAIDRIRPFRAAVFSLIWPAEREIKHDQYRTHRPFGY